MVQSQTKYPFEYLSYTTFVSKEYGEDVAGHREDLATITPHPLQCQFPKSHISPNTKVSNKLNALVGCDGNLSVGKTATEILTYIKIYYKENSVTIPEGFTAFDREVHDAVCSIWEYGDPSHTFTVEMLYRVIIASRDGRPSPAMKKAIEESLERQRRLIVEIDATEEVQAHLKRRNANRDSITAKWSDSILSLREVTVRNGSQYIKAYRINSSPPLLDYAKATGKILTSKSYLLDIKKVDNDGHILSASVSNSFRHILIKMYLWRRVLTMKYDEKSASEKLRKYLSRHKTGADLPEKTISSFRNINQRKILLQSAFESAGVQTSNRTAQKRNRDYVMEVLNFWRAAGFIKDYRKTLGERKAVTGIEIIL